MQLNDYLPECPICYDALKQDLATSSSCGHIFHTYCLEKWMGENNICPICRRVIKNKIKLIYNFSIKEGEATEINSSGTANSKTNQFPTTNEMLKENSKLAKEKKILQEEKTECEKKLKFLDEQLAFYASQFREANQSMKEYKSQMISLNCQLEETDTKNKNLLEEIEAKERRILEIEKAKKELESRLEVNKGILELLSGLEKNKEEEFDIKGTVENYFKKPDGVRCLTNFIYVLNRKISDHQEEIEKCI